MTNIKQILRKKELSEIEKIIHASSNKGQIILLEGYAGAGKSTILEQLEKRLKVKKKPRCLPFIIKIGEYDTNYEYSLYMMLHDEIKGFNASKWFKRFIETISVSFVVGVSIRPAREEPMSPRRILNNFLKDLKRFEKGDVKLLLGFDDYHKASNKVFESMIKDIAKNLPRNVVLTIATRQSLHKEFFFPGIEANIIKVPFFSFVQTRTYLKRNLNIDNKNAETLAKLVHRKLKGHPRSIARAVLLSKEGKKSFVDLLREVPEKGWEEATYYISREVIDALHIDERNLVESCFVLPYLDNEICSYILRTRSAFSILVRLDEKLIIKKRDSIYDMEDLTKEYLEDTVPNKRPLYIQASRFFLEKADNMRKDRMFAESAKFGLYACDFIYRGQDVDKFVEHVADFIEIFLQTGYFKDSKKYLENALRFCGDNGTKVHLLINLGDVHRMLGQYDKALKEYQEAKEVTRQIGDLNGKAWSLRGIAEILKVISRYNEALEKYQESYEIFKQSGDIRGKAWVTWGIARAYRSLSQYDKALKGYQRAKEISEQIEDVYLKELSTWGVGETYRALGQYNKALEEYQEAKELAVQIGDFNGKAWNLRGLAECHRAFGYYDKALEEFKEAQEFFELTGEIHAQAWNIWSIAETYRMRWQFNNALEEYEKAKGIANSVQSVRCEGWILRGIGETYRMLNQHDMALKQYEKAKGISEQIGDKKGKIRAILGISEVLRAKGDYENSLITYVEAKKLAEIIGSKTEIAHALLGIAESYRMRGITKPLNYENAMYMYNEIGMNWGIVHTLIGKALSELQFGEIANVKQDLKKAQEICKEFSFEPELELINKIRQERKQKELHALNFPYS